MTVAPELACLLRVRLEAEDDEATVEFPVVDLENYHQVDWRLLGERQRERLACAYALWRHRQRWGGRQGILRVIFDPSSDPYPCDDRGAMRRLD